MRSSGIQQLGEGREFNKRFMSDIRWLKTTIVLFSAKDRVLVGVWAMKKFSMIENCATFRIMSHIVHCTAEAREQSGRIRCSRSLRRLNVQNIACMELSSCAGMIDGWSCLKLPRKNNYLPDLFILAPQDLISAISEPHVMAFCLARNFPNTCRVSANRPSLNLWLQIVWSLWILSNVPCFDELLYKR